MVCQTFFTTHAFNLIDIKVISTQEVVIGAYLVFTDLECKSEADMVALVTFFSKAADFK